LLLCFAGDLGSFLHFLAEKTPVVVKSGDPKKLQKAKKAAAVGATALVELRAAVCLGPKGNPVPSKLQLGWSTLYVQIRKKHINSHKNTHTHTSNRSNRSSFFYHLRRSSLTKKSTEKIVPSGNLSY